VRSGEEVHLFYLAAAAALLLHGFGRVGQGALYVWSYCALLLGGALYLFAVQSLSPAIALGLLAAGLLVLLDAWRGPALAR
jgi:hypothetical protein